MMSKKRLAQALNFIEYISKPMSFEDMHDYYLINGIKPDKTELFYDFIYGLYDLIINTHMGDELMSYDDNLKHFKWCWEKTIDNFKKERIYFGELHNDLYDYFLESFLEGFYSKDKIENEHKKLIDYWKSCFDYSGVKTMSEMESLMDLYKLFNGNLYSN